MAKQKLQTAHTHLISFCRLGKGRVWHVKTEDIPQVVTNFPNFPIIQDYIIMF